MMYPPPPAAVCVFCWVIRTTMLVRIIWWSQLAVLCQVRPLSAEFMAVYFNQCCNYTLYIHLTNEAFLEISIKNFTCFFWHSCVLDHIHNIKFPIRDGATDADTQCDFSQLAKKADYLILLSQSKHRLYNHAFRRPESLLCHELRNFDSFCP